MTLRDKGIKPTQSEKLKRVSLVKRLSLEGMNAEAILRYFAEVEKLNLGLRTIEGYMQEAREAIKAEFKEKDSLSIQWHIGTRLDLYRLARLDDSYKDAIKILDSLAKLQDYFPTAKNSDPFREEILYDGVQYVD